MIKQNEKKDTRDNPRSTNDTPLQRGRSADNDFRAERQNAYTNGDRDSFDTVYGAPGEFPATDF